jgi:ubiquinone/menaquinone biosynthesis C-methylase UbiE
MVKTCLICGGGIEKTISVKEEMYAMGGDFRYGQCSNCKCLQCLNPPENMGDYYPSGYYSFDSSFKKVSWWKFFRRGLKRKLILWHPRFLNKAIYLWLSNYQIFWTYRRINLKKSDHILDVGAGGGDHVLELKSAGLNAVGVDPFLQENISVNSEVLVYKGSISSIDRKFDLVTFHHSFEHIPNQHETLEVLRKILNPGAKVLIRIPTVTSDAFDFYREKWCQLDAPRHLYLHSHQSIKYLATKHGFEVQDIWCDSSDGQFIFSEQYQVKISLFDHRSYLMNKKKSIFSSEQLKDFGLRADLANKNMRGDQICILLELNNS